MYEKIRDEMKAQNLSVNKLSFISRIAQPDLCSALNGKKPFFPAWRQRVAAALGVPEETLFNDLMDYDEN